MAFAEADKLRKTCEDLIRVKPEGWVPLEEYEEAKKIEQALKRDTFYAAESPEDEERIREHWLFE
ncbi:uncharacterized protein Z519_12155 [Cladophialophora bantiana CBS 173.52]|uniref:Uncharacterized protein n=1 Tax=Cladophialophora bantiana (strain ATCC 10958 / CBS 173.52 / CDC B-1940 / NIH 8579) TaxID=1442370 RepID=A0A0D2FKN5_CLAB1|nr:uncharacterized protein Z519_12155 [Cladophialophora bantiana CBS 173.52]KIW87252.1 hypothetical protein Z519_12155 [Cladophialophora bantiana CBS 173.52]